MSKEITIKHANVLFVELEDKGYGRNVTIDVTDDAIRTDIENWANENGLKLRIKDYTQKDGNVVKQLQLKFSKFMKVSGKESAWTEQNLGFGAVINLIANVYDYDNKFGKGTTASISNIFIIEPATNSKMDSIAE